MLTFAVIVLAFVVVLLSAAMVMLRRQLCRMQHDITALERQNVAKNAVSVVRATIDPGGTVVFGSLSRRPLRGHLD